MFGSDLRIAPEQERTLRFELTAANGVARATRVGPDSEIASESFDGQPVTAAAEFAVTGEAETAGAACGALTVEDAAGKNAYSNPIWIMPLAEADVLPAE